MPHDPGGRQSLSWFRDACELPGMQGQLQAPLPWPQSGQHSPEEALRVLSGECWDLAEMQVAFMALGNDIRVD